ncbi:U-box domain-containing protein 45-like [Olea europaea var. sylvestris]|uniref:U-box domain-containing 45-like n=1 Tax=Olea europaea subsp. europaea TaxID=158383 RepID=A0A8S0UQV1_OLEEU|nr:U-box domain-containing protein 45-like [Olea europaea var. sylvestris]CAA3021289.1 U-box domain-containing 45-like [Olea europaea subsp. europaea]
MGKFEGGKVVGSVELDRNFTLSSAFSGASFRRKIINAIRCGGGIPQKPSNKPEKKRQSGSNKLSELLKQPECRESEDEIRKKEEYLEELKRVAKKLQQESNSEEELKINVLEGATDVRRFTKEDSQARTTLALLGVIPPLVAALDAEDPTSQTQIAALYALLNLTIANDANKAAIVKAGAVHKMLKLVNSSNESPKQSVAEAIVANFLGLSALDSNKPIIGSSGAIPFLVETFKDFNEQISSQAKQDSLRALYNLSILPSNVLLILETDLIPLLLSKLGDVDASERILSILSNVVSVAEGRKAIRILPDAFPILIDVLNWTDSPGCQEKVSYILMVIVHKSYGDRQAMIEAGIASSLLELTLLGSTLAQKRASRILECLRVEKGKQVSGGLGSGLSAPLYGPSPTHQSDELLEGEDDMLSEERKAVGQLVQQSLHNNMKRMMKRANLPRDFVASHHFKSLSSSSTSKSLPF